MCTTIEIAENLCSIPFANCDDTVVLTDDETDEVDESRECLETLSRTELPRRTKQVRFAMDDRVAIQKRKQRNLRKTILQKSRSTNGANSPPSPPNVSSQGKLVPPPSKQHARRRKTNLIASAIAHSF